jgi:hypothetical protein
MIFNTSTANFQDMFWRADTFRVDLSCWVGSVELDRVDVSREPSGSSNVDPTMIADFLSINGTPLQFPVLQHHQTVFVRSLPLI